MSKMRLLDSRTLTLKEFLPQEVPPYAILSHMVHKFGLIRPLISCCLSLTIVFYSEVERRSPSRRCNIQVNKHETRLYILKLNAVALLLSMMD